MWECRIGPNRVLVDGDLITSYVGGPGTLATATPFHALAAQVLAEHGRLFLLTVNEGNHGLDSEARRYAFNWLQTHKVSAAAMVGGGTVLRTTLTLLARALVLFSANIPPFVFVASEREALAYIDQQRRRISGLSPAADPPSHLDL